jgi:predicted permease
MAGGYLARRTGLVKIESASGIMSAAIIGVDAPIALFALWFLRIHPGVWKVPVAGLAVAVLVVLAGLAIARWRRMAMRDRVVFALQSGMGNVGYTLGGAIAFAVWGLQGLSVEQMFCMMWPFFSFLFCWPLAHHYADPVEATDKGPRHADIAYALRILGKSLADIRSLPLYLATLGLVLNLAGTAPPQAVADPDWHVLDALMVIGIIMQFGSVGLTVRVSRLAAWWKPALGSAALKFLLCPVLMLAAVFALGITGDSLKVCLMLSVMPTALYSVLIANLFRLNTDLANTTFLLTTLFCLAVIVPAIVLLARAGLLT